MGWVRLCDREVQQRAEFLADTRCGTIIHFPCADNACLLLASQLCFESLGDRPGLPVLLQAKWHRLGMEWSRHRTTRDLTLQIGLPKRVLPSGIGGELKGI